MNASIPQSRVGFPVWVSTAVWLAAFFSPIACFLLLLLSSRFQINLPETFVLALFFVIPVVALLICESIVWSCSKTVGRKVGWMLFTLVAMLLQFAVMVVVLREIIMAAIGYAQ